MQRKISLFNEGKYDYKRLFESFNGWNAYAKWSNSKNIVDKLIKKIRTEQCFLA